jgi:hypothetical protein
MEPRFLKQELYPLQHKLNAKKQEPPHCPKSKSLRWYQKHGQQHTMLVRSEVWSPFKFVHKTSTQQLKSIIMMKKNQSASSNLKGDNKIR